MSRGEAAVYDQTLTMIYLLRHGIPYDAVLEMDEMTMNTTLGVLLALDEREREQLEANARADRR